MIHATVKGRDLQWITKIKQEQLDHYFDVEINHVEDQSDPDWITTSKEEKIAYQKAMEELKNWETISFEDLQAKYA